MSQWTTYDDQIEMGKTHRDLLPSADDEENLAYSKTANASRSVLGDLGNQRTVRVPGNKGPGGCGKTTTWAGVVRGVEQDLTLTNGAGISGERELPRQ